MKLFLLLEQSSSPALDRHSHDFGMHHVIEGCEGVHLLKECIQRLLEYKGGCAKRPKCLLFGQIRKAGPSYILQSDSKWM